MLLSAQRIHAIRQASACIFFAHFWTPCPKQRTTAKKKSIRSNNPCTKIKARTHITHPHPTKDTQRTRRTKAHGSKHTVDVPPDTVRAQERISHFSMCASATVRPRGLLRLPPRYPNLDRSPTCPLTKISLLSRLISMILFRSSHTNDTPVRSK
jgi:hypothetical protein